MVQAVLDMAEQRSLRNEAMPPPLAAIAYGAPRGAHR